MAVLADIRCDRCGLAGEERYAFCERCSLFVCSACWDAEARACLSCTHPRLPVRAQLQSAIRSTVGDAVHPYHGGMQTRVSRSLAASAQRRLAAAEAAPAPAAARPARIPVRRPSAAAMGSLLRLALVSLVLAVALIVLPALLTERAGVVPRSVQRETPRSEASVAPTRRDAGTQATTYVVRPGDTLHAIAARFYGDALQWRRIFQANRDVLSSPDALAVGMELRIPALD